MPRILRLIGSISVVVMLVAWGVEPRTARADDCLAQPNSSAPAGNHWYYHTDRATQRKCWYLRALDQPAQQPTAQATSQATPTDPIPLEESAASGGVPISAPPGASTSSLPHIKMLSVVPDPLTPPMAIVQAPIATQTAAQTEGTSTESVQPTSDARAPADDAQDAAQATASPNGAGGANVVVSVPVEMSLVAAFGLVVAGFLFRIAMTARRRRIFIVRPGSHWLDYRNEHELYDEQQSARPVHQRKELINDFIDRPEPLCMDDRNEHELRDRQQPSGPVWQWNKKPIQDLQGSPIPDASDYRPHRPSRNDYDLQKNPHRRDRDSDVANEISKPEDMLEQLKRDIDRVLSPKVA
jgi:hypothetical protein